VVTGASRRAEATHTARCPYGALEAIHRSLDTVAQYLKRGDEARARKRLDDLVANQTTQGLPDTPIRLAKTLSKAAELARDADRLEWLEELYRETYRYNRQDPIAACGLADILKARGDLDEAERQYRDNIQRWPSNEITACGLAESAACGDGLRGSGRGAGTAKGSGHQEHIFGYGHTGCPQFDRQGLLSQGRGGA